MTRLHERQSEPALLAISHGTSSPKGQRAVAALTRALAASRPELAIHGGFVDVQQPDVATVISRTKAGQPAVVVPLLLSAGYHVHVDLREEIDSYLDRTVLLAASLGPDDRLVSILAERLHESGLLPGDRIVLAAAGSSDARAVDDCHETARLLAALLGQEVHCGFISAASPSLGEAIDYARSEAAGGRVVLSSYLLAPGYFADLARAAGADIVSDPLLKPEHEPPARLVELVAERYEAALAAELVPALS